MTYIGERRSVEDKDNRVFVNLFIVLLKIGTIYSLSISFFNFLMGYDFFNVLSNFIFFLFFLSMLILYSKKPSKTIELTTILFLNYFVTPVMWIHSSGTKGGLQYLFFLVILAVSVFSSGKMRLFLTMTYLLLIQTLIAVEYFHPDILLEFENKSEEYTNSSISLLISLIIISYCIFTVVNLYTREHEEIRKLSETDYLTGIYNRKKMLEFLKKREFSEPGFLAVADIDDFKKINDNLGHRSGDLILKEMANSLLEMLDEKKDRIGRMGGDEFLIFFGDSEYEKTLHRLEKIDKELFKRHSIRISYGLAEIKNADSLDHSIHTADMAMYDMKRRKKSIRSGGV